MICSPIWSAFMATQKHLNCDYHILYCGTGRLFGVFGAMTTKLGQHCIIDNLSVTVVQDFLFVCSHSRNRWCGAQFKSRRRRRHDLATHDLARWPPMSHDLEAPHAWRRAPLGGFDHPSWPPSPVSEWCSSPSGNAYLSDACEADTLAACAAMSSAAS